MPFAHCFPTISCLSTGEAMVMRKNFHAATPYKAPAKAYRQLQVSEPSEGLVRHLQIG